MGLSGMTNHQYRETITMADFMAAEIHVGGKVPRSVAQALCKVLDESGASLEWGDSPFRPQSPDDLLSARSAVADGPLVLKLCDDQARWGEFDALERFLREHDIPYRRWSDGKYEHDPEAQAFHPEVGLVSWLTDHERRPMAPVSELEPILQRLTDLLEAMKQGYAGAAQVQAEIEAARDSLRDELPPPIPPLETLEIIEE